MIAQTIAYRAKLSMEDKILHYVNYFCNISAMRLMSHSDDMRFQCYLLEGQEEIESLREQIWAMRGEKLVLNNPDHIQFILWDAKNKGIVGRTSIIAHSETNTQFSGSFIMPHLCRQGLSKILYDARKLYMQENELFRKVKTFIDQGNNPSWRAAEGNDFEIERSNPNGPYVYAFKVTANMPVPDMKSPRYLVLQDPEPRLDCFPS